MKRSIMLCGLLLSTHWVVPIAAAQSSEGMVFSEIHAPPAARDWRERTYWLENATVIEMRVLARTKGSPDRMVELTRTSTATVGCLVSPADSCRPLRELGLGGVPVDLLLDLLVANVPAASPATLDVPGSWRMPSHPAIHVGFSNWSFNPEAGMKMPGKITLTQAGLVVHFQVERFRLVRRDQSAR